MQVVVGKWGNNLAVRLPGDIVQAAKLHDGERVDIDTVDGAVVIRRVEPRIALAALFQGRTAEQWRTAYADAYDDAYDWGADAGQEAIPE